MHIPDGYLSVPVTAVCGLVSICGLALAIRRLKVGIEDAKVPTMGVIAAFVFAAQMLNFPIAFGVSGHVLGGLLAAIIVGPEAAVLVMSIVLIFQALLFGDGGLTALGANVLNMALIGSWCAFAIFKLLVWLLRNDGIAIGVAAWLSVVLSSSACAVELWLSGSAPLKLVLPLMAGIHAIIGIGEALVTSAAVVFVKRIRPQIISTGG
ncbi:MAG: energy-coupling factor ABC transporter permease [Armatimonadota bacterium]|nr:energy-coupling factor ABC transporter permease [Armatimonadota bacterium]MCX7777947.1 energy-coupling factor ABC transporter permease [Armatimonadota bacterium]MDW8025297.1 energy-coupling factor ABC transporter permease [Armatimonadota bacterium]